MEQKYTENPRILPVCLQKTLDVLVSFLFNQGVQTQSTDQKDVNLFFLVCARCARTREHGQKMKWKALVPPVDHEPFLQYVNSLLVRSHTSVVTAALLSNPSV